MCGVTLTPKKIWTRSGSRKQIYVDPELTWTKQTEAIYRLELELQTAEMIHDTSRNIDQLCLVDIPPVLSLCMVRRAWFLEFIFLRYKISQEME